MLTQIIRDGLARLFQFDGEQVRDQWQAAAATRTGLRTRLDLPDRGEFLVLDGLADLTFQHVIAGTNLSVVRHAADTAQRRSTFRADDQLVRFARQSLSALRQDRPRAVFRRVADKYSGDQALTVETEEQLLVDTGKGIFKDQRGGRFWTGFVIAKTRDINAHQFQFGR